MSEITWKISKSQSEYKLSQAYKKIAKIAFSIFLLTFFASLSGDSFDFVGLLVVCVFVVATLVLLFGLLVLLIRRRAIARTYSVNSEGLIITLNKTIIKLPWNRMAAFVKLVPEKNLVPNQTKSHEVNEALGSAFALMKVSQNLYANTELFYVKIKPRFFKFFRDVYCSLYVPNNLVDDVSRLFKQKLLYESLDPNKSFGKVLYR